MSGFKIQLAEDFFKQLDLLMVVPMVNPVFSQKDQEVMTTLQKPTCVWAMQLGVLMGKTKDD